MRVARRSRMPIAALALGVACAGARAEGFAGRWMLELDVPPADLYAALELERTAAGWAGHVEGGLVPITIDGDEIEIVVDSRDIAGFVFERRLVDFGQRLRDDAESLDLAEDSQHGLQVVPRVRAVHRLVAHGEVRDDVVVNQQLQRANEDLAETGRAKDEFLAHISHELRTPLNSILGFSKLILDGLAQNPEEERALLRDVFTSAQHLLSLVNDLLDIGRIEAGRMSMHLEDIQLRHLLDSTLSLVAIQAIEKRLDLRDETLGRNLPPIRADEVRLRQVLLNLLTNAVQYTPQGRITIRARSDIPGGFLRLEIEDTGVGIPPAMREAVFREFVRVGAPEIRSSGGTGLGLAISRRLIELMGGRIGIEDGSGGTGTRVWLTLPLAPRAVADSARDRSPETASR